jgi:phosphatidate cytidylyltransferase
VSSSPLRLRIITGAVLAAALLLVLLELPVAATRVVLFVIVLAGAWEWSAFVRPDSLAARVLFVLVIAALLPLAWSGTAASGVRRVLLMLTAIWWCIALIWVAAAPQRVGPWSAALAGVWSLVPMGVALMRLRSLEPHGSAWTLYALVLVWAADIGGFFAGRRFGRTRLAPRVSPGKTWEGVIGGVVLGVPVALVGAMIFQVPWLPLLCATLAAIGFSVVGDLTESMLKRHVGLKDSGWLIPGHGGVMDRIDSVTAAAPIFLLGLTLIGDAS